MLTDSTCIQDDGAPKSSNCYLMKHKPQADVTTADVPLAYPHLVLWWLGPGHTLKSLDLLGLHGVPLYLLSQYIYRPATLLFAEVLCTHGFAADIKTHWMGSGCPPRCSTRRFLISWVTVGQDPLSYWLKEMSPKLPQFMGLFATETRARSSFPLALFMY